MQTRLRCGFVSESVFHLLFIDKQIDADAIVFSFFRCRQDRRAKVRRHIKGVNVVSASTSVRNANGSGCRGIPGRIWDRSVLSAI